jgi:hypothetical protein
MNLQSLSTTRYGEPLSRAVKNHESKSHISLGSAFPHSLSLFRLSLMHHKPYIHKSRCASRNVVSAPALSNAHRKDLGCKVRPLLIG